MDEYLQELIEFKERCKSNTKRIDGVEERLDKSEELLENIDKSLAVTIEQIKNIAEDLKTTSVNFKEAIMRSNTANSKETELLKEKYNELEKKYEKLASKLEQETIGRDAKNWRDSKSKIIAWRYNSSSNNNSFCFRHIKIFIGKEVIKDGYNTSNTKLY